MKRNFTAGSKSNGKMLFLVLIVFLNCQSAEKGKRFFFDRNRPPKIGITTVQDALRTWGPPLKSETKQDNDIIRIVLKWEFSHRHHTFPLVQILGMEFNPDTQVLEGYDFTTSYPEQRANYEFSKRAQLKRGKSTIENAYEILGFPSARYSLTSFFYPRHIPKIETKKPADIAILEYASGKRCWSDSKWQDDELLLLYFNRGIFTDIKYRGCIQLSTPEGG